MDFTGFDHAVEYDQCLDFWKFVQQRRHHGHGQVPQHNDTGRLGRQILPQALSQRTPSIMLSIKRRAPDSRKVNEDTRGVESHGQLVAEVLEDSARERYSVHHDDARAACRLRRLDDA